MRVLIAFISISFVSEFAALQLRLGHRIVKTCQSSVLQFRQELIELFRQPRWDVFPGGSSDVASRTSLLSSSN